MSNTVQSQLAARRQIAKTAVFDVNDLGKFLRCSPRHCYRLADSGRMPRPVKIGSLVRWLRRTGDPMTGVEDWLEAGCPLVRRSGR